MAEIIFGVAVILGILFILCKLIGKIAQVFSLHEITSLMSESLSMQTGNFSSKRKD